MNQEHLTPAEQNHLKQDFRDSTQEGETGESGREEKVLEENSQGQNLQQQPFSQEGEKEDQEGKDGPPDPQKDFMGYMQWLGKALQKQELLHEQQQSSPTREAEQLQAFYQQSVASVKQKHQDFDQAADFIYETRAKQLAAFASLYPELADPQNIDARIGDELKQILRDCAQKNQNPAEVIYAIAQNFGYTNVLGTMGENLQERHNSARTLAAYNGLAPNGAISLDMLDKMSETEFSAWVAEPKNKAAFNRLMGGREF
ncbi:hypothetical protein [Bartonella massiliensis]|uniref:hypothetical protein n=1 Tax=Bartonella massiliensis TaxID=929795 RepID=UPI00115B45CF|nr:hypothetical protein [Bartonella massiliensis]